MARGIHLQVHLGGQKLKDPFLHSLSLFCLDWDVTCIMRPLWHFDEWTQCHKIAVSFFPANNEWYRIIKRITLFGFVDPQFSSKDHSFISLLLSLKHAVFLNASFRSFECPHHWRTWWTDPFLFSLSWDVTYPERGLQKIHEANSNIQNRDR